MSNKPVIKAIFIDLDGTLLGSSNLKLRMNFIFNFYKNFKKYKLSLFRSILLMRKLRLCLENPSANNKLNTDNKTNYERAVDVLKNYLSIESKEAVAIIDTEFLDIFIKSKSCFYSYSNINDIHNLLEEMSTYSLVLATNPAWPKKCVLERLSWSGIASEHFDFISTSETMHSIKPNLNYYTELLERFNLKPEEVLMVGDPLKKDAVCKEVGIDFIQVHEVNNSIEGFQTLKKRVLA